MLEKGAGVLAAMAVLPASEPMMSPPVPPLPPLPPTLPSPPLPLEVDVGGLLLELHAKGTTHIQGSTQGSSCRQPASFLDRCVVVVSVGFVRIGFMDMLQRQRAHVRRAGALQHFRRWSHGASKGMDDFSTLSARAAVRSNLFELPCGQSWAGL